MHSSPQQPEAATHQQRSLSRCFAEIIWSIRAFLAENKENMESELPIAIPLFLEIGPEVAKLAPEAT